ncbi:hypothetical protein ACFFSY_13895 [Paenibacillus aurantiacus]|uniref:Uncharacterized protein n=1 Tax=Paenibacillus aurantiacus TaxID=1936118 RepID=A0ABV5KP77_9BACL
MYNQNDLLFQRAAKTALDKGIITPEHYEKLIKDLRNKAAHQTHSADVMRKAKERLLEMA